MTELDALIVKELKLCEFKFWYPLFSKHSMKSHILELPIHFPVSHDLSADTAVGAANSDQGHHPTINMHREFTAYLQQDGIVLPEKYSEKFSPGSTTADAAPGATLPASALMEVHDKLGAKKSEEKRTEVTACSDSTVTSTTATTAAMFNYISSSVSQAMKSFRSKDDTSICYFIKTNWSCPSDAKWILTGQCLKCYSLDDVYMVLKASDRILYDIELIRLCNEVEIQLREQKEQKLLQQEQQNMMDGPEAITAATDNAVTNDPHDIQHRHKHHHSEHTTLSLITRKWANLHPSMEFRCFVRGRELIAVSQRECTTCFPFLVSPPAPRVEEMGSFSIDTTATATATATAAATATASSSITVPVVSAQNSEQPNGNSSSGSSSNNYQNSINSTSNTSARSTTRSELQEEILDRISGFYETVILPCTDFPSENCKLWLLLLLLWL